MLDNVSSLTFTPFMAPGDPTNPHGVTIMMTVAVPDAFNKTKTTSMSFAATSVVRATAQ